MRTVPGDLGGNLDIFGDAIPARRRQHPTAAVRTCLMDAPTNRAYYLAKKAFVMLEPRRLEIVWPLHARSEPRRGYAG